MREEDMRLTGNERNVAPSAAHTPGPWYATNVEDTQDRNGTLSYANTHPEDNRGLRDGNCWTVSLDPEQAGWATDMGHSDYGLNEANARLMAAAPDLLKALKMILAPATQRWRALPADSYEKTAIHIAEAAIAKANAAPVDK